MSRYFKSDNTACICPEILAAIAAANSGYATGYGDDPWSQKLDATCGELFGTAVRVFPVATGTGANSLALAALVPPWGAIYAHEEAHILRDECGAVEAASGGARIICAEQVNAKLTPESVARAIAANPSSVHTVQPAAISISQASEYGRSYRPQEIAALAATARQHDMALHMDGARFANSVAFLQCTPAELTWRAGVDVLSFGATKNGAMAAEAVVFFNVERARHFELRRKRGGHLLSKQRFVSAQLLAYVENDLWLRNACHANDLAQQIATACGQCLMHPVEANEIFVQLDAVRVAALRALDFEFYDWGAAGAGAIRLVVSWSQSEAEVAALCAELRAICL